MTKILSEFQA